MNISSLQKARYEYAPKLPGMLRNGISEICVKEGGATQSVADQEKIKALFPNTYGKSEITFQKGENTSEARTHKVGVILSGGQAPGGHNVICGLYDALKATNKENELYGFKGGPSGLLEDDYVIFDDAFIDEYRNTGGFDIIGSGRTKLETEEQFAIVAEVCKKHGINIVAGKGSKEHLDREHYIIKKQHEENEIREQEIQSEHQQLMAMVNEQAGVVLSAQEDVNKQLEQIQDFLQNTEQGKQYAMYAQIEEMNQKANDYDMKKEQEKRLFAQFWDAYKSENSAYWKQYRLRKQEVFQLLQDARQGKKHNEKMLNHHLEVLTDGSENLLFKLISLIAIISLYFQKGHLEAELAKAEAGYKEFKDNARVVLTASKDTSIALKSKDYDNAIQAMNNWNTIIAKMNEQLNMMQFVIEPKQYER